MATANMTADQGFLYVKSENSEHSHNHHHHHQAHKSGHKRPRIEPLPAAATNDGNSSSSSSSDSPSTPELMRCKRRINFAQMGYNLPQAPPAAVARRNERERNRVKLVNMGFATLREHVPNGVKNKKMSKVETLRSAVDYIKRLQELLDEQNPGGSSSGSAAAAAAAALAGLADTFASDGSTTGDGEGCYNNGSGGGGDAGRVNGDGASSTVNGSATGGNICLPSSVSPTCSVASSPTPSYASDCSSYEPLSPEEEDLLDFTTWFS